MLDFFGVLELGLLSATSHRSRWCQQLRGLELQLRGLSGAQPASARGLVTLDASLSCSGPQFPHLSKGRNGGTWSNETGSSLELCRPSPKYPSPRLRSQAPLLWGLSFRSSQPVWRQPCPSDSPAVTPEPGLSQQLPTGGAGAGEPAVATPAGAGGLVPGLVQDSGPASTMFGKDNCSAL